MDEQGVVRINSQKCELNEHGELICETPESVEITEDTDVVLTDRLQNDSPKPKPQKAEVKPQSNITV